MNRIFRAQRFFAAPDGTAVSPFMNATDNTQDNLPWGALADMSIAAGRIAPGVASWIHVHPVITQVTYLRAGKLCVRMKSPGDREPAEVLYIASPSYVFERTEDAVVYDDAVIVARTWGDISGRPLSLADRTEYAARRVQSLERLSRRSRSV